MCQTADIWSTRTKSYIGITIHWIDAQLQRQSSALACRRFSGTHSYDRIASLLNEINNEFGISTKKIVATVTDNAVNFCKAFKEFGIELKHAADGGGSGNASGDEDSQLDDDVELSQQQRCRVHTINLIPTTDLRNFFKTNAQLATLNSCLMVKLSKLWAAGGRPKSGEKIKEILG